MIVPTMSQRFTDEAWYALDRARRAALHRGAEEVTPEHLLYALLSEPKGTGALIVDCMNLDREAILAQLAPALPAGRGDTKARKPFSPGARQLMDQAKELAGGPVGTEHLLLALLDQGQGTAFELLSANGAEASSARQAISAIQAVRRELQASRTEAASSGASRATLAPWIGDAPRHTTRAEVIRMWQRFTERARRVVFFAQEEAARLGENYVGTEHLLLGLIRESDSAAARILDRLGVPLGRIRAEIEKQVGRGKGNLGQDMQLTPRAKRVIDLSYEEARQLNNNYIGTEHLLLGLVREGDGLAARVLVKLGADVERTRREVSAMQEGGPSEEIAAGGFDPLALLSASRERLQARTHEARGAVRAARQVCAGLTDLRAIPDLTRDQAQALLHFAQILKLSERSDRTAGRDILEGRVLAMVFEKPSLRTRVSFEAGMVQLGGHAIYLQPSDISMGKRESVADVARNLERHCDTIMARVFSHQTILDLAEHSRVPVINGLCDREHPCQALADLLTVQEKRGAVAGQKIAYVGDGNNVAHSLMLLGAMLGAHVAVATPPGYEPLPEIVQTAAEYAGGTVYVTHDPREAVEGADAVYTDVWASMGQEAEAAERAKIFAPYQVNGELVALAKPDYLFLHCLPAHRGEEVSAGVMDGPNSVVFDQAENRRHAQKAVLAVLIR
jgi:ornithine carbamoyltransferase